MAILNTSLMATHAQASLRETIAVMSARVISEASLTIPLQGRHLDQADLAADPELSRLISRAIFELVAAIAE